MFKEVDIGDRVWSFEYGWGEVFEILPFVNTYPVRVRFDVGLRESFTVSGCRSQKAMQTLFWDEVDYKKPVKKEHSKTVKGFIGFFKNYKGDIRVCEKIFERQKDIPKNFIMKLHVHFRYKEKD